MNTCFNVNVFLWQTDLLVIHDIDTNDSRQKVVTEGQRDRGTPSTVPPVRGSHVTKLLGDEVLL